MPAPWVRTRTDAGTFLVWSPKCPRFASATRKLGGKWRDTDRCWAFPAGAAPHVQALCRDIYGEDGGSVPERVTVRVRISAAKAGDDLHEFGREVWPRPYAGVAIVEESADAAVVEMYDVPASIAQDAVERQPGRYSIAPLPTDRIARRAQLESEETELLRRLQIVRVELSELIPGRPEPFMPSRQSLPVRAPRADAPEAPEERKGERFPHLEVE